MNDAVDLASLPGDDRHHEPLVADCNELFLECPFFAVRLDESFERGLNGFLLLLDVAAKAVQRDACVVGNGAIR